jgi:cation diffusion facilitator family transporter
MVQVSFFVNLVLFGVKTYIFANTGSLAVLASLLDSSVDLLAQGVLMIANRLAGRPRDAYQSSYPAGISRVEPIGVIICAVTMSIGAFLVICRSGFDLYTVYGRSEDFPEVTLGTASGAFLLGLIALKAGLWLWCRTQAGKGSASLDAVADDHRNDVASNSGALVAAAVASASKKLWATDPIGAILISLWIIKAWCATAKEQADLLVGKAADPAFLDLIREIAETHDPSVQLDTIRAYHFGPKFLVEIELIMARDTPLVQSHDVGIMLQHKVENLEDCERCFVHIDYQHREDDDHDPSVPVQRKIISDETPLTLTLRQRLRE